ncbi:hypothetical protein [Exiguobacterium alkaliphilum]|uniref:hypothetical protein n=1 Tax=Exiguobacterium alkaliphilum TaxID=1428684 RepID=UPI001BA65860|nr:hypothetical protein [Exiguobacterium alkaliphilum]QUE87187.1 hypothetical protein KB235_04620 [Exiguobacterium alkaliphilum]
MHVSERLLQLYAELDASTRNTIQASIKQNLGDGKPLSVSYEELTGKTSNTLPTDEKSGADFTAWIKDGKKDTTFLPYYVALLENGGATAKKAVPAIEATPPDEDGTVPEDDTTEAREPVVKQRYMPEAPVPSRAERAKYQRAIEPARPKKKSGAKWLGALALIGLLIGGGYIGYPYVSALFEPSEQAEEVAAPTEEAEPVAETPAVTEVWLTEKNVSLLSEPNGDNVTYIGDIGDRYDVLEERDDHLLLDLGIDGMTAWAPVASTTTEWKSFTLSDQQVLNFLQTGVDQIYLDRASVDEYLAFSEAELYELLGQPFGRDADALNDYSFYTGIFFVIQDEAVHAIDWTNTPTTKEAFRQLGTPVYETEDAIVFESPKYSLRMFVGANGTSTRIRVTEI